MDTDRKTVEPGDTVTVRFGSRTDGVTIQSCSVTPDATKQAALSRLSDAATVLLGQDVTDVFCAAWRKHRTIRDEAAASLAQPDARRGVGLATHAISFAHEPSVELRLGGHTLAAVTLQIQLDLLIKGLRAIIKAGRLTEIGAGTCDLDGSVAVSGMPVTQRQVTLPLPLTMRLRNGYALVVHRAEHLAAGSVGRRRRRCHGPAAWRSSARGSVSC